MSKIYIPVCFATAAGMLLCPIFGAFVPEQGLLINTLYNIFILVVWCLLVELAGRTNLGAVRVFGFGRGASALATTIDGLYAACGDDACPERADRERGPCQDDGYRDRRSGRREGEPYRAIERGNR